MWGKSPKFLKHQSQQGIQTTGPAPPGPNNALETTMHKSEVNTPLSQARQGRGGIRTQDPDSILHGGPTPCAHQLHVVAQTEPGIILHNTCLIRSVTPSSVGIINQGKMALPSTQGVRHPTTTTFNSLPALTLNTRVIKSSIFSFVILQ